MISNGTNKRYFWLKLKKDFFNSVKIKMLKKKPNGDTMIIIYLKMLLMAIDNDGIVFFQNAADTIEEEISIAIDEDSEIVLETINYLLSVKLAEWAEPEQQQLLFTEAIESTGSETETAKRVRKFRDKNKMLQSNEGLLQSNKDETQCNEIETQSKRRVREELETESEIEIETEIESEIESESETEPDTYNFSEFEKYSKKHGYTFEPKKYYKSASIPLTADNIKSYCDIWQQLADHNSGN